MGATPTFSLITSFLIHSNLVYPKIHRSILISATINLWTWGFLIGQHSKPYTKANLTIIWLTTPFNPKRIFLSHNTPEALLSFCHPTLICWLTSLSIPPSFTMISPKYMNFLALGIATPTMVTSSPPASSPLSRHFKYSVLNPLNLNHLDSKVFHYC